jgi:hypothetical protein
MTKPAQVSSELGCSKCLSAFRQTDLETKEHRFSKPGGFNYTTVLMYSVSGYTSVLANLLCARRTKDKHYPLSIMQSEQKDFVIPACTYMFYGISGNYPTRMIASCRCSLGPKSWSATAPAATAPAASGIVWTHI